MKNWRFCVNAGFFGKRRDRFTEYQPDRSLEEKFRLISQINDIEGVELKYPLDLKDVPHAKKLLNHHNLTCSAVNVDIKDAAHFRYGALSARDSKARNRSVAMLREGKKMRGPWPPIQIKGPEKNIKSSAESQCLQRCPNRDPGLLAVQGTQRQDLWMNSFGAMPFR